jgi:hypothetical protein
VVESLITSVRTNQAVSQAKCHLLAVGWLMIPLSGIVAMVKVWVDLSLETPLTTLFTNCPATKMPKSAASTKAELRQFDIIRTHRASACLSVCITFQDVAEQSTSLLSTYENILSNHNLPILIRSHAGTTVHTAIGLVGEADL